MAERFGNFLEPIQRCKHDAYQRVISLGRGDSLSTAIDEQIPIGKISEPIVISQVLDFGRTLFDQFLQMVFVTPLVRQQLMM